MVFCVEGKLYLPFSESSFPRKQWTITQIWCGYVRKAIHYTKLAVMSI